MLGTVDVVADGNRAHTGRTANVGATSGASSAATDGQPRPDLPAQPSAGGDACAAAAPDASATATVAPRQRGRDLGREASGFAIVGAFGLAVDVGGYNLLVHLGGDGWLAEQPLVAKTLSLVAGTTVAYVGNRFWTYRHHARGRLAREYPMFVFLSVLGLGIALACLAVSRYVLGLTSVLADNRAANVIGLGLGSVFRFLSYRRFVFRPETGSPA